VDKAVAQTTIEPPGVDDDANNDNAHEDDEDEASNDDPQAELETFVNELETALDDKIDKIEQLDNDHGPRDNDNHEMDDINADPARQQSSADNAVVNKDNNDEDSDP
jgi:hypothetical protein